MRGQIWGLITAAVGLAIIVLLAIDGIQYGIWVDEIGPSLDIADQAAQPTLIMSAVIGVLAIGLVIGGLAVGLSIPRGEGPDRPARTE